MGKITMSKDRRKRRMKGSGQEGGMEAGAGKKRGEKVEVRG
jgi:hypothetical protein